MAIFLIIENFEYGVSFFYYVRIIGMLPPFPHECLQKSLTRPDVPFTQLDKGGSEKFREQKALSTASQVIDSHSTPDWYLAFCFQFGGISSLQVKWSIIVWKYEEWLSSTN